MVAGQNPWRIRGFPPPSKGYPGSRNPTEPANWTMGQTRFRASPWPALGCAAAVTQTLKLGTCVIQAGGREPMQVAADAATLDILLPTSA
jgi:alkanesulfonate monooxygenase SsuD/methylene tetrahydromethanopterin reductase-like flavin-dependent oxidoreductase (luciferase family)